MADTYVLTLTCPDRAGLVFAVTRWIAEGGGNILDSQQFTDTSDGRFFLRVHFEHGDDLDALRAGFAAVAAEHAMEGQVVVAERPTRTLVLVSKEGHCLNDLLYRQSTGAVPIEVPEIEAHRKRRSVTQRERWDGSKSASPIIDPDGIRRVQIVAHIDVRRSIAGEIVEAD